MLKIIFIIFIYFLYPQIAQAENYNGEWIFDSHNNKCSNFFKWDNTKIIIKNNKATYTISNTNGWSHEYIGKLKKNKKLNMNGLDASISGKFINNNQLEIKFTNIRESWEWVNMLSKCIATFTNAKDDKAYTPKKIAREKEYIVFCVGSEDIVYARQKSNECPSEMKEISRDEFCSSISKDDRILDDEDDEGALLFNASKFKRKYCDSPLSDDDGQDVINLNLDQLILQQEEIQQEEIKKEIKNITLNPISKPEF